MWTYLRADIVALLASQVMKEDIKRLKTGLKTKKKGEKSVTKKISELLLCYS